MAPKLQGHFDQSISPLLVAIQLPDDPTRHQEVARILREFSKDKAASLLFATFLKSQHSESKERLIDELAYIGSSKSVEILKSIASDDSIRKFSARRWTH